MKVEALFYLFRMALGNEEPGGLPKVEDWVALMVFAQKQGVGGVAYDGIMKAGISDFGPKDARENRRLLTRWSAATMRMEEKYRDYVEKLGKLNAFLTEQGLPVLVMKGYGNSLNWPVPEHRPTGDVDIFSADYKIIDERIEKILGIPVGEKETPHSKFCFKGLTVENHRQILKVKTHPKIAALEPLMEELATTDYREVVIRDRSIVRIPGTRFNSIHLLRHAAEHLYDGPLMLRHVLDWATFVSASSNAGRGVDWSFASEAAHRSGMNEFMDAMNGICVEYLGYPEAMFPIEKRDDRMRDKLLAAILDSTEERTKGTDDFDSFFELVRTRMGFFGKNWWRFRIIYGESPIQALGRKTWGYVKHRI